MLLCLISEIFPICYAIVDCENDDNWRWFLHFIAEFVRQQPRPVTFFSDRHSGLVNGIKELFPGSPHCYCIKHLNQNIERRFGKFRSGEMLDLFGKMAYACTKPVFQEALNKFLTVGKRAAAEFLQGLEPDNYSIAWFPGKRFGEMSNATAESFNKMIEKFRRMPIMDMVEALRVKVMEMISFRRDAADKWCTVLCPKKEEEMKLLLREGMHWRIAKSNDIVYEVHGDTNIYKVNVYDRSCSCVQWQFNGFPCAHALQVLLHGGFKLYDYIEYYWTIDFYKRSYEYSLFPVPDLDKPEYDLSTAPIKPPITKKQAGRPKTSRCKSHTELTRSVCCSRCGQPGHNRAHCKNPI